MAGWQEHVKHHVSTDTAEPISWHLTSAAAAAAAAMRMQLPARLTVIGLPSWEQRAQACMTQSANA